MLPVLRLWYLSSPAWVWAALRMTISRLDGRLAVRDTVGNITKPIFQDYTTQGRIIGFFFRIGRLAISLIAYAAVACAYAFLYLIWLAFPLICAVWIVGSIVGPRS